MTETRPLYNTVAPLRNVSALTALIERVENRDYGLPGLATFHGYSGYGKTTAAVYAANHFNAYTVQVKSMWNPTFFCQAILREMGIEPQKGLPRMGEQIARELSFTGRPLIIDDAQELGGIRMLRIVKDIYESAGTTIILIGEETLPQRLSRVENVAGRVLEWQPAYPACLEDIEHLARMHASDIELSYEFKEKLLVASVHSIRRVCTNLSGVKQEALKRGLKRFGMAEAKATGFRFAPVQAPSARRDLQ